MSAGPLQRAQEALARGDAAGCLGHLQALDDVAREAPLARLLQATALLLGGRRSEGLARLEALAADLEAATPGDPQLLAGVYKNLAIARLQEGAAPAGLAALRRAFALAPGDPETCHALAALLVSQGQGGEALEPARRAVELRPGLVEPKLTLARALRLEGQESVAGTVLEQALALDPGHVEALVALARIQGELGSLADFEATLGRVLARDPDHPAAAQARLMALHYHPEPAPGRVLDAHLEWGRRLRARVGPVPRPRPRDPDPERPLRIGYLGADFRSHSCAGFLEPLLRTHRPSAVEVLVFSAFAAGDAQTEVFRGLAQGWHDVQDLDDRALAARIREAGVDVLVDLGGHTAGSRLAALAWRPAPIQISWLGYPTATGLDALDGRITDAAIDPPGAGEGEGEPPLRLDPCYLCWQPPAGLPPRATARPRGRPFTFASFNHFAKLNDGVMAAWAALLRRVPGSRLLLKARGSRSPELRDRIARAFAEQGVPARRIEFLGFQPDAASHLHLYAEADLALDPFPYNGVTTTLEALWMGTPVLALEGSTSLGRQTASFLRLLGLDPWVAADPATYVETGLHLAADPDRLAAMAAGLRERLAASAICDAPAFARRMEDLVRRLWRQACIRAQTGP